MITSWVETGSNFKTETHICCAKYWAKCNQLCDFSTTIYGAFKHCKHIITYTTTTPRQTTATDFADMSVVNSFFLF